MKICILCPDSEIGLARQNTKRIFKNDGELSIKDIKTKEIHTYPINYIGIPVSESGSLPATHWFCFLNTDDETYNKIVAICKYSTIESCGPKQFLEKWNLKIIEH